MRPGPLIVLATLLSALATAGVLAVPAAPAASAALLAPQIHTVAGNGGCAGAETSGGACDGVAARSVAIGTAASVSPLPGGGYLYVDRSQDLVRAVSPAGTVSTVAGNGTATDRDGVPAIQSGLDDPVSVAALPTGGFIVTEYAGAVVRRVTPGGPGAATITTIAGTGTPGDNAASGPATAVELNYPTDAQVTAGGQVLIADSHNDVIRALSAAAPGATLSTVAGGGVCDDTTNACQGVPATAVALHDPWSVSAVAGGGFLIAENDPTGANAVRRVSATGAFTTAAGVPGQRWGFGGDGGPATSALLSAPQGVTSLPGGGFLIADTGNNRVRAVAPDGTISTLAGTGAWALAGDGGPAVDAALQGPVQAQPYPVGPGQFLVADAGNGVIREITAAPVSTITFGPDSSRGRNGWFVFPVTATVTTTQGATVRCVIDPVAPPAVFAQLAPGCPLNVAGTQITGDGAHTVWAAGLNSFGDGENPVAATVNIDTTTPTVTCARPPTFRFGQRGATVTAAVSDPVSGPAARTVSARVRTRSAGRHTVDLQGASRAGIDGFSTCRYTVLPLTLRPMPGFGYAVLSGRRWARFRQLLVIKVPADAAVSLACQGSGCPFATAHNVTGAQCGPRPCVAHPSRRRRPRTVDLTPLLVRPRLSPRAQVIVSVTAPNTVGRVWVLTLRSGRHPAETVTCLAPGSFRPGVGCARSDQ